MLNMPGPVVHKALVALQTTKCMGLHSEKLVVGWRYGRGVVRWSSLLRGEEAMSHGSDRLLC